MEQLISLLFLARDLAHREHLRTDSFAQHMALGEFYDGIIDNADALAEAYMGSYGVLKDFPIQGSQSSTPIIKELEKHVGWIDSNRYKACDKDDTPIQNLIDAAVETYLTAIFKLKRLK